MFPHFSLPNPSSFLSFAPRIPLVEVLLFIPKVHRLLVTHDNYRRPVKQFTDRQGNTAFGAVPLEIEPQSLAEATNDSPIKPNPIGVGAYHPSSGRRGNGLGLGVSVGLGFRQDIEGEGDRSMDVRTGRGRRAGGFSASASASPEKRSEEGEEEETMEIEDDD
jgi:hypothetical protein